MQLKSFRDGPLQPGSVGEVMCGEADSWLPLPPGSSVPLGVTGRNLF
jgi:hypothetical protein